VTRPWAIGAAIAVGWALAAVALWWSGYWYAETNRYDACQLYDAGEVLFWACPVDAPPSSRGDV
jgi:hypothetical protein